MVWGIFAFVAIIAVVSYSYASGKTKDLEKEGLFVKRDISYIRQGTVFFTSGTYNEIEAAVKATEPKLSQQGIIIKYFPNEQAITLESNHKAWIALLEHKGTQDGKNVFMFSFPQWQTRNGVPTDPIKMNVAITAIEKAMLAVDPQTAVESHELKIKTK